MTIHITINLVPAASILACLSPDAPGIKSLVQPLQSKAPKAETEDLINATAPLRLPTTPGEMRGPEGLWPAIISDCYITGSDYLLDLQARQHGLVDPAKRKARALVSAEAEGYHLASAGEVPGQSRPPDWQGPAGDSHSSQELPSSPGREGCELWKGWSHI